MVSPEFFDKLVTHASAEKAYTFAQGTAGTNPLKDDVRRGFRFGSILFEEYFGTVTLSTGDTVRLIPEKEGIAFPLGTFDAFRTGTSKNLDQPFAGINLPSPEFQPT
ncbi:major capsid protein [Caldichromatium japonicum]|uniref:major capsid protein n=1 Tax=Caldichromatium japonicum TaxID=2699430 RepID=UPI001FE9A4C4|nr:major capsid protein [Caldichromatium japonicum]